MAKQLTSLLGSMESLSLLFPSQTSFSWAVPSGLVSVQAALGPSCATWPLVPVISLSLAGCPVPYIGNSYLRSPPSGLPLHQCFQLVGGGGGAYRCSPLFVATGLMQRMLSTSVDWSSTLSSALCRPFSLLFGQNCQAAH